MSETSLHLKVEMLNEVNGRLRAVNDELRTENERLKRKLEILKAHGVEIVDAIAGGFEIYDEEHRRADALEGENARYRELVEILRRDWHIEASWDGLRKFWYVGLTEDGIRERDERDAKAMEAANIEIGELRALCKSMRCALVGYHDQTYLTRSEEHTSELQSRI